MINQFKDKLAKLLKSDERFYNEERDSLFKNKITECAHNLDAGLINLLLNDPDCRGKFFKTHKVEDRGVTIFDKESFIYWINHHEFLPDSYTRFKQNIGLSLDEQKYLRQTKDVSLIFPYKDCVLQGGQSKEDAKRNEIFYNEVLAPDQIDRLFDQKVLTNFKHITSSGEKEVRQIDDLTQHNLIVKGNNLLALYSLKDLYRGKVKLIYIDPPYNTGGDANIFTYNNSFNHSTWLTFMKNRLEVAREFLRDDGFIAIAIDHYELFYLGCLADEIFGRENRLGVITVRHFPGGRTNDRFFSTNNEYMLIYSNNIDKAVLKYLELNNEYVKKKFNKIDEKGNYRLTQFARMGEGLSTPDVRPNLYYPIYYNFNNDDISLDKKENYIKLLPIDKKGTKRVWRNSKETFLKLFNNNEIIIKNNSVYKKVRENKKIKPSTIWYDGRYSAGQYGTKLLKDLLNSNNSLFSYPKSLYTVLDTLKITTDKDDIIMDFHAGSGTTGHAVLELNKEDGGNRKFILVEQLDEHIAVCRERIEKVIKSHIKDGEEKEPKLIDEDNGKDVKELVKENYLTFELAQYNQKFVEQIEKAPTTKELVGIYEEMEKNGFLSYQFRDKEFREKLKEFKALSIPEQKKILLELLDKNMLYLNYEDIEDRKYGVNKKTIRLNKMIYGEMPRRYL